MDTETLPVEMRYWGVIGLLAELSRFYARLAMYVDAGASSADLMERVERALEDSAANNPRVTVRGSAGTGFSIDHDLAGLAEASRGDG